MRWRNRNIFCRGQAGEQAERAGRSDKRAEDPNLLRIFAKIAANLTAEAPPFTLPRVARSLVKTHRRPLLAGAVAMLVVGCGPLGGCSSGKASAPLATAPRPEEGHERPEEGGESAPREASAAATPLPPVITLSEEAALARIAAQKAVLGREAHFGEYARELPLIGAGGGALEGLPGSAGGEGAEAATPAIPGDLLGLFVPIEGAEPALEPFYGALRRLRRGEDPDGKVRILLYGASHTAADIYPTYLRSYLGERFGDGGLGFVALAKTNRYYRLLAWELETSKGWKTEHAQRKGSREDGLFGLLGASASASKARDVTRVKPTGKPPEAPHKTRYELFFLKQPGGGKFSVKIDGEEAGTVDTKAKAIGPGYFAKTIDGGPHEVELRPLGKGEVRVFGMTVENDAPGVVVDTLGINGTRAANHLKWDEALWTDQIRRRAPDLYVLAYGTNEALDEDQPIAAYKGDLRRVLDRFARAAPTASCLLVGPGDFPIKTEGGYVPRPRTAALVAAQREVALEKGCAFWDALAFMGGEGSMALWARAEPAMGRPDHIHLSRRGYVRMGMAITDALMQGFEEAAGGADEAALARSLPQKTGQGEATGAAPTSP